MLILDTGITKAPPSDGIECRKGHHKWEKQRRAASLT